MIVAMPLLSSKSACNIRTTVLLIFGLESVFPFSRSEQGQGPWPGYCQIVSGQAPAARGGSSWDRTQRPHLGTERKAGFLGPNAKWTILGPNADFASRFCVRSQNSRSVPELTLSSVPKKMTLGQIYCPRNSNKQYIALGQIYERMGPAASGAIARAKGSRFRVNARTYQ